MSWTSRSSVVGLNGLCRKTSPKLVSPGPGKSEPSDSPLMAMMGGLPATDRSSLLKPCPSRFGMLESLSTKRISAR